MTQTIEQLTARVRELEAENAELHEQVDLQVPKTAFTQLKEQLAAEQLNNKLLRDALRGLDDYCDPANHTSFCECDPTVGYQCAVCHWPRIQEVAEAREALSTPASTEALDAYVAEKVKEAGKFDVWKTNPYTKVLETSIKQLTKQRDLAVEALEAIAGRRIFIDNLASNVDIAVMTLGTIKESEAK